MASPREGDDRLGRVWDGPIMEVGEVLDAAILVTTSVFLVATAALLMFWVTAVLERWIRRDPAPRVARHGRPATPALRDGQPHFFDQDADVGTRRAS
jgi:hypothetical protein